MHEEKRKSMFIYINFSFNFICLENVYFTPMYSWDVSFFKPFKTLAVRALSE
jgi:hypothetical protein